MSALVKSRNKASGQRQGKDPQHDLKPERKFADGPYAIPIPEACDRLDSSRAHVYPFIMSGELRTFKLGRRRFTTPEWLSDFMCRREATDQHRNNGATKCTSKK